jgi:hypothetical protein
MCARAAMLRRIAPGPNSAAARVISENHGCTLRQHSASVSLLKVPSQRTAVILADPAVHSRRYVDAPEADLRRSIERRLITRPAGPAAGSELRSALA